MKHGSLFSGIGGFDLAAKWLNWNNVFHCEKDQFCRSILKKHFPESISYGDIKTTDFTIWRGLVDVISGGFPCQPFSTAGKRKGINDERYLWPEMLRAIKEVDPAFIVGENVYGIAKTTAPQEIVSSLENLGYIVVPFNIPASAVGALHRRSRVWFVGIKEHTLDPNTNCIRSYCEKFNEQRNFELLNEQECEFRQVVSESIRNGTHPRVFRDANGIPNRVDRLRAIGNAVVPQVAYEIFKTVEVFHKLKK